MSVNVQEHTSRAHTRVFTWGTRVELIKCPMRAMLAAEKSWEKGPRWEGRWSQKLARRKASERGGRPGGFPRPRAGPLAGRWPLSPSPRLSLRCSLKTRFSNFKVHANDQGIARSRSLG